MVMQAWNAPAEKKIIASLAKNTTIISEYFILPKKTGMIFVNEHEKKVYFIFEINQSGDGYQLSTSIGQNDGESAARLQQFAGNTRKEGIDFMVKTILEGTLPTDMNYESNSDKLREILNKAIESSFLNL